MKKIVLMTFVLVLLVICCKPMLNNANPGESSTQTTTSGKPIISIEKLKENVIKRLKKSGSVKMYINDLGQDQLLKAGWGPIILVNDEEPGRQIGESKFYDIEAYYAVYAQLPDQSLTACMSFDAVTGEYISGSVYFKDSDPIYILTEDEALLYAQEQLNLSRSTKLKVTPTFSDRAYYHYLHHDLWFYKVTLETAIKTKAGEVTSLYIDPYVIGAAGSKATSKNTFMSRLEPHRIFVLSLVTRANGTKGEELVGID